MTDAAKIKRVAERHEADDWRFFDRYSGRGMFGAKCPGIVCPPHDVNRVESAVRMAGVKGMASGDSMGLDRIVYWPWVNCDEPEPEAELIREFTRVFGVAPVIEVRPDGLVNDLTDGNVWNPARAIEFLRTIETDAGVHNPDKYIIALTDAASDVEAE
jgi:hypothetical protein